MLLSKFLNALKLTATILTDANILKDYSDYKTVDSFRKRSEFELM